MKDELVLITGLYAYVNVEAYWRYIYHSCDAQRDDMFNSEIPVRVNTLYPATGYNKTWVSVTTPERTVTSFPVDLIIRFTNIRPAWDALTPPSADGQR